MQLFSELFSKSSDHSVLTAFSWTIKYAKLTTMFKKALTLKFISIVFIITSSHNIFANAPTDTNKITGLPHAENKTFANSLLNTNEVSAFEQAVHHLHKKESEQAQTLLMKLLKKKPYSAPLLYNLGLAFYQQKKLPQTLAYWRRAIFHNPYNTTIKTSLKHIDSSPFWLVWPSDIVWAIQFLLWTGFVFLIYKKQFFTLFRIWPLVAISIQVVSVLYFYPRTQNYATLVQNTSLHSYSNVSAPVLFEQNAGVLLKIKKIKNNWSYVLLSDIKEGWIPSELLIPLKNTDDI